MSSKTYQFNEFYLDLSQKTLRKNDDIVQIQPKVFDVLAVLVKRNNDLISREDLMKDVWGDTFVEETSLRLCIHTLRKIFDGRYIQTVPKRGYRFNAEVNEIQSLTIETQLDSSRKSEPKSHKNYFIFAILFLFVLVIIAATLSWKNIPKADEKMTIKVFPFTRVDKNIESNPMVADAIITQLTKLTDFRVLSVASVDNDFQAILQGSFRQENDLIKVSANLQNAETNETIWSENFDVKSNDETDLEILIATRLARLFSLKMTEYQDEKIAKRSNINSEALNAYLSARKIWRVRDLGRVGEMGFLLNKATELEPTQAFIKSAFAESALMDDYIITNYDKAKVFAEEALKLDEKQFGSLTVLGQIELNKNWNFAQAEQYFKKSIEINPHYASTYNEYAKLLAYQRNFAEAERISKKALEIEPFSPLYNTTLCEIYYFDQKIDAALKQCKFATQLEPDFWLARKQLFWIYVYKKMNKEVAEMILRNFSDEAKEKLSYYKSLQKGDLDEYWRHTITTETDTKNNYLRAMFYVQLNEKKQALECLEKATEGKEWIAFRLNSDPIFEPLWNEDRFLQLQKRLKTPN